METSEKCLKAFEQLVSRDVELRFGHGKKKDMKVYFPPVTGIQPIPNWV